MKSRARRNHRVFPGTNSPMTVLPGIMPSLFRKWSAPDGPAPSSAYRFYHDRVPCEHLCGAPRNKDTGRCLRISPSFCLSALLIRIGRASRRPADPYSCLLRAVFSERRYLLDLFQKRSSSVALFGTWSLFAALLTRGFFPPSFDPPF